MNLTPKQEKFCKVFLETGNASEAYRQAYDAENMQENSINVNASKLLKETKIALRIDELKRELEEEFKFKIRDAFNEYDEAREIARQSKEASTMIRATDGKCKLFGLHKERFDGKLEIEIIA